MLNEVKVLERQVFRPFKQEGARSDIVMVGNICVSHGLSVMIRLMSQKKDQSYQHFRWAQWTVRGSICVVAALLAMQVAGPAWLAALMPSLSVFTALLAVAAGGGGLLLSGALVMAVICVFKPRFFCRWVCPVGTCRDVLAGRFSHRAWVARVPQLGLWLVCVGVGAALMGYPLFGWLDPLVIFNAFFGTIGHAAEPRPWGAWVGLPMLLLLSVIGPWLWCGRLCPLGAMQDLLRSWTRFKSFAKGCGVNQQVPEKPSTASGRAAAWQTSRRVFLGLGLGAGYRLVLPPGDTSGPETALRPPASRPSSRFTRLCVRCGNCVRACPSGIIRWGGTEGRVAGMFAPEIHFDGDYCPASCTVCSTVCPTGAIPHFTRMTKSRRPIGCAQVDATECLLSDRRECGSCIGTCPHGALDADWDSVEMVSRVVVNQKACTGCGYCEYVCPALPKAIQVKPL